MGYQNSENIELDVLLSHQTALQDHKVSTKWRFKGWRFSLVCGAALATLVFILNLSLLIWASVSHTVENKIVTLYTGSCSTMEDIFTWTHFSINILSTLLLSASNVCMQCLAAPTRVELNKQHSLGKWLDIGITSLRNLRSIARWRFCLWVAVGLSSIPLHLLYNSVVFSTITENEFVVVVGASNFIGGPPVNTSLFSSIENIYVPGSYGAIISSIQTDASSWENLTNAECITAYNQLYVRDYRNLVLVTGTPNNTNPVLNWLVSSTNNWLCFYFTGPCHVSASNAGSWNASLSACNSAEPDCFNYDSLDIPIEYCLAQPVTSTCKVQLGQVMLVVVIICNAVKIGCMVITIYKSDFEPLITTGDALSSFLSDLDETTTGFGPLSAIDVRKRVHCHIQNSSLRDIEKPKTFQYAKRARWFRAASPTRWGIAIGLFSATWLAGLGIFIKALYSHNNLSNFWSDSLGEADTSNTIYFKNVSLTLTSVVLISNAPQLVISFLYVIYNNLFTCMLSTAEVCDFAKEQKGLRVSEPKGDQRSTYWLSLPYRYAIPLMILMSMLHWFISQSIFLLNLEAYNVWGDPDDTESTTACGYSAKGLVASIVLGGFMIIILIGFGLRRFTAGIPILSNCSIAMSAACHPLCTDFEISRLPLKYGVLQNSNEHNGYERVGFGTVVLRPLVDRRYTVLY